jgi:hypothetical protein
MPSGNLLFLYPGLWSLFPAVESQCRSTAGHLQLLGFELCSGYGAGVLE